MPSIGARLKSANSDAELASPKSDRRSADAVFLSTASITPELSRVSSTPLSSEAIDSLQLQASSSQAARDQLNGPSPLTMAPPKPGPADTLYPSPSGGFVPSPEEGQDWRLKPPPAPRNPKQPRDSSTSPSTSSPSSTSRTLPPVAQGSSQSPIPGPIASPCTSTPTRPPSLPSCPETASKIASAGSLSRRSSQASSSVTPPSLRPVSSSSSSRHRLSATTPLTETAASIGASTSTAHKADADTGSSSMRNSTASTAPHGDEVITSGSDHDQQSTRPDSTASYQTARNDDNEKVSTSLVKVRDFAYPSDDPRHYGQQLPEPQSSAEPDQDSDGRHHDPDTAEHDFYIDGAEDENEFDGDEGDHAIVPEGIYNVLYEFDPVSEHELAVLPGEVVHVIGSLEGGWAIAVKDGDESVKGLVPATYLEWSAPLPE